MHGKLQLFCPRCATFTHHASQGRYDHMGALKAVDDRCLRCGRIDPDHEIPATVDAPNELSQIEIMRCYFHRYRVATGTLTEWPGDWWDATPGVWG